MDPLAQASHEHHDRLIPHVKHLARLAEMLDEGITPGFQEECEAEHRFIVGQLLPHMEAIEATLYGKLDRLMEGRHSMAPMRREHAETSRTRRRTSWPAASNTRWRSRCKEVQARGCRGPVTASR